MSLSIPSEGSGERECQEEGNEREGEDELLLYHCRALLIKEK